MIVPCDSSGIYASAESPVQHLCPFREEKDVGSVEVVWRTTDCTLELHALRAYLDTFSDQALSHEDLTARVFRYLDGLDGPDIISVSSAWVTAGLGVSCSTSAIPART